MPSSECVLRFLGRLIKPLNFLGGGSIDDAMHACVSPFVCAMGPSLCVSLFGRFSTRALCRARAEASSSPTPIATARVLPVGSSSDDDPDSFAFRSLRSLWYAWRVLLLKLEDGSHTELLIMVPHCSARSHKTAEPFARVRKFNITGFRRYTSSTAREKYRRNGIFAWRIALHCGGLR